jgi:hypothetical protein
VPRQETQGSVPPLTAHPREFGRGPGEFYSPKKYLKKAGLIEAGLVITRDSFVYFAGSTLDDGFLSDCVRDWEAAAASKRDPGVLLLVSSGQL